MGGASRGGWERPLVSVVVPTRGRPQLLRRCLAALEAQTLPVEVVVVEDGEGRGPAWARNEGVRRAEGEVVCFTDDDCEPAAGWAEALAAPILAGEVEVATGPVSIGNDATVADKAWEAIVDYLQVRAGSPGTASPGFAVTANLAARREWLVRLPFDESFPVAAGEDRDWGERAMRERQRRRRTSPGPWSSTSSGHERAALSAPAVPLRPRRLPVPGRRHRPPSRLSRLLRGPPARRLWRRPPRGLLVGAAQVATLAGILEREPTPGRQRSSSGSPLRPSSGHAVEGCDGGWDVGDAGRAAEVAGAAGPGGEDRPGVAVGVVAGAAAAVALALDAAEAGGVDGL